MGREVEWFKMRRDTTFKLFVTRVGDLFLSAFFVGRVLLPDVVEDPRGDDQVGLAEGPAHSVPDDLPLKKMLEIASEMFWNLNVLCLIAVGVMRSNIPLK